MRVDALSAQTQTTKTSQAGPMALDRQAFLQLLVAQLRNQDPMNPVDNKEFVSQLAQLTSLEQMETLNRSIQVSQEMEALNQSLALLGRRVQYLSSDGQSTQSGVVEGVQISEGLPTLVVGGQPVLPGDVISVGPA